MNDCAQHLCDFHGIVRLFVLVQGLIIVYILMVILSTFLSIVVVNLYFSSVIGAHYCLNLVLLFDCLSYFSGIL